VRLPGTAAGHHDTNIEQLLDGAAYAYSTVCWNLH